jgi:hypothetical protein
MQLSCNSARGRLAGFFRIRMARGLTRMIGLECVSASGVGRIAGRLEGGNGLQLGRGLGKVWGFGFVWLGGALNGGFGRRQRFE